MERITCLSFRSRTETEQLAAFRMSTFASAFKVLFRLMTRNRLGDPPDPPVARGVGIVNVASIPQLSPFRYPGGKTWLVPYARLWLRENAPVNHLIEPFAGGGIISLTAVSEHLARRAVMVECDPDVAAVWKTVLKGRARWLAEEIVAFEMSPQRVSEILEDVSGPAHRRAFATILRNRVQRGGIMAAGAGLMKDGENGRGLRSRWYPETLRKRILAIAEVADRLSFIEGDGLQVIRQYARQKRAAFFIDPPYTVAGRRLYSYSDLDHPELFKTLSTVNGTILMTYDFSPDICALARQFGFDVMRIPMKSTHHARKYELLIGRDLEWLRRLDPVTSREFAPRTMASSQAALL